MNRQRESAHPLFYWSFVIVLAVAVSEFGVMLAQGMGWQRPPPGLSVPPSRVSFRLVFVLFGCGMEPVRAYVSGGMMVWQESVSGSPFGFWIGY